MPGKTADVLTLGTSGGAGVTYKCCFPSTHKNITVGEN